MATSFKWSNQARGKAGVTVVIIGFATFDRERKELFEYVGASDEPIETRAKNINPFLVDAANTLIKKRNKSLCDAPKMMRGIYAFDGGFLLLTDAEKDDYVEREPQGAKYIRPIISATEFLHNIKRWCFWLVDADPSELRRLPLLRERIAKVKEFRLASKDAATRKLAEQPHLFRTPTIQPTNTYLAVPRVTSENRKYVPLAFLEPNVITNTTMYMLESANLYQFGMLQSSMHMAWIRQVCGRMRLDLQYSNDLAYNNFAWPQDPRSQDVQAVKEAAEAVLTIRERYPNASLADLYDPLFMPKDLLDAHKRLDKAVDRCYRREPFATA